MTFDQQEFDVRCEWGEQGVSLLASISDVCVIVDVLCFSTSVDLAVSRGAIVFPYRWRDDTAVAYAAKAGAELADARRSRATYSLSPESLTHIPTGTRIVLPSPNGSTLTLAAKPATVMAGCLRNARAVALAARKYGRKIAIIPAGERWGADYSLRPSFEDLIGAGAIISHLPGRLSPESLAARAAFREVESDLRASLKQSSSGKELIERGFENDVVLASLLDSSDSAPVLVNDAYVQAGV
jgi:2-phosphosulfolactate phosphatase